MKISIDFDREAGFTGMLTLLFVALKILGYLKWSWLWVWSPIWISALIAIFWIGILFFLNMRY